MILMISILLCIFLGTNNIFALPPICLDQPLITYTPHTYAGNMGCWDGDVFVTCWIEYTYGIRTVLFNGVETKEIIIENIDINSDCPCQDYYQKSVLKWVLQNEQAALGVSDLLAIGQCDTIYSVKAVSNGCYQAKYYYKNMKIHTRFEPCYDSECCYDQYLVIYCKTNCPYPTCSPVVTQVSRYGQTTITGSCTHPCYSWCGKFNFENPDDVSNIEDAVTSEPYNGPFLPKISLETPTNSNNDIKIIPNPVNSICTIEIDNEYYGNAEVIIYDISGNVITTIEKKKEKGILTFTTNLNSLQSGTYFCVILIDGIEIGNNSFVISK